MSTKETIEEPVSFIEDDGDHTVVDLSPEKPDTKHNDANDERLRRAELETQRLSSELSAYRQQQQGGQRQPQYTDQYEAELSQLNEREKALGVQFEVDRSANRLSKAVLDDYDQKAREIQNRKSQITAQRAIREALPDIINANQAQQFRSQYADVYGNPRAQTYAEGVYKTMLASGEQDGPDLVHKAMNQARVFFKMPSAGHMKPTDQDKAQLTGVSGNGGRSTTDNRVRMTKAEKSMAMAMYGDQFNGDEKKVYAKWAAGPGLKAKKEMSRSSRA